MSQELKDIDHRAGVWPQSPAKSITDEVFGRDRWRHSDLNQREYCELHGLPLKRFGNWRAKYKDEDDVPRRKLLQRCGGAIKHMSGHMSNRESRGGSIGTRSLGTLHAARRGRRRSSESEKRRIVEELGA